MRLVWIFKFPKLFRTNARCLRVDTGTKIRNQPSHIYAIDSMALQSSTQWADVISRATFNIAPFVTRWNDLRDARTGFRRDVPLLQDSDRVSMRLLNQMGSYLYNNCIWDLVCRIRLHPFCAVGFPTGFSSIDPKCPPPEKYRYCVLRFRTKPLIQPANTSSTWWTVR